jgi:hypothetical protein
MRRDELCIQSLTREILERLNYLFNLMRYS